MAEEKRQTEKSEGFFYGLYKKIYGSNSIYKRIVFWYLIITIIGSLFLFFPLSHQNNSDLNYLNALFLSASAFSDTGLSTVAVSDTFNFFGEFVIFTLILLGGVGWFTFKYFIITYIFSRTANRKTSIHAKEENGFESNYQTKEIIKVTFFSMITIILLFGIIFGICFALIDPNNMQGAVDPGLEGNWGSSFWTGFFHANSSVNNAGFDIFRGNVSLTAYYGNYFIQILTILLFVFGGIGFAVIYDVWLYLKSKSKGRKFNFSFFTKIAAITYFSIAFGGLFLVYIFEFIAIGVNKDTAFLTTNTVNYGGFSARMWALTFNTFSTRNAGFSTIDISILSPFSKITQIFMMFIGSGPGSTAGGIRTTTFAVLFVYFLLPRKKEKRKIIFNREISRDTGVLALKITIYSLILVLASSIMISMDELWIGNDRGNPFNSYLDILYLTASAFGTVGLSTVSMDQNLNVFSLMLIILIMFIGQVGMPNLIKSIRHQKTSLEKEAPGIYIKEDLNLG